MQVSVVIPHYNDLANLDVCLDLLTGQTLPRERFEIIVADNNSRCGLGEVERVAGNRARVVPAPEQGAGPARNRGVAAGRGEALAFIDSDCVPASDWLENGLAALTPGVVVGGRVDVVVSDPRRPRPVEAFEMATAFPMRDYVERKHFVGTGNLFLTRADFERVGPFRSTVAEDMEWSRRAIAAGLRLVYADDVAVGHPARASWDELERKWARTTHETHALALERPGGRLRWLKQCLLVLASIGPHSARMLTTGKLPGPRARLDAIAVLARIRWFRFRRGIALLLGGA